MRQYEWLKEGLLEVVWEGIGDSRERVHSHHLRVDKKMRGFYHGREGQLDGGGAGAWPRRRLSGATCGEPVLCKEARTVS
tara:strand:- start:1537 stop:1776 length:240 start_codon:yes stop_codon:yes gene_type:complete